MKALCIALLALGAVPLLRAADGTPQITKSSDSAAFDAGREVKAFYLQLLERDEPVKTAYAALLAQSPGWEDAHPPAQEPRVIPWFPSTSEWNVGKGFYHDDERFLVVQPVGFARAKWSEIDSVVAAEFRAVSDGKMRLDPHDPERVTSVSNQITIQFLGFRSLSAQPGPPSSITPMAPAR